MDQQSVGPSEYGRLKTFWVDGAIPELKAGLIIASARGSSPWHSRMKGNKKFE